MMDIRSAYAECQSLILQIEDALTDPANYCIRHILERQLTRLRQRRDDLCYEIQQEQAAYWTAQGHPELADGDTQPVDTQPVDTSAILHAEMKHQPRHEPDVLYALDATDYDPPIVGDER